MYTRYISLALAWVVAAHSPAATMAHVQNGRRPAAESSVSASGGGTWKVQTQRKRQVVRHRHHYTGGTTVNISAAGTITWAPPGWNTPSTVVPRGTRPPYDEDKSRFPMPDAGCGSLIRGSAARYISSVTARPCGLTSRDHPTHGQRRRAHGQQRRFLRQHRAR